ncbi:hypothetical protein Q5H93_09245 [Hymenobacter sp. ASUV-10]|uniref:STAS/SEC14 domain-containing protein n=1 Tax=Hymenobacter aranciens TaxID=3063996 RepID=A0ABT9BAV9_9BACT|nr:hypothetical protein [Hymenobacter sp. ASUV-10]MDO7874915.1 hypothetical protein [Hymenobacter sp. ASUV-10]
MSLQILLNEPHIILAYDRVNEWIFADWRGRQDMASVQAGCRDMLRLMVEHRCHKLLNDNHHVDNLWSEAAEWVGTEFLPALARAGLKHLAWVYSPSAHSRLATDLSLEHAINGPVIATFEDLPSARTWLQQQP